MSIGPLAISLFNDEKKEYVAEMVKKEDGEEGNWEEEGDG